MLPFQAVYAKGDSGEAGLIWPSGQLSFSEVGEQDRRKKEKTKKPKKNPEMAGVFSWPRVDVINMEKKQLSFQDARGRE